MNDGFSFYLLVVECIIQTKNAAFKGADMNHSQCNWRRMILVFLVFTQQSVVAGTLELADQEETPGWATLQYRPDTGRLTASASLPMTTLEIISTTSQFRPANVPPGLILFPFAEVATERQLLLLRPSGLNDVDFGEVLPPDLSSAELISDLRVAGSHVVDALSFAKLYVVPEPAANSIFGIVAIGMTVFRRRNR